MAVRILNPIRTAVTFLKQYVLLSITFTTAVSGCVFSCTLIAAWSILFLCEAPETRALCRSLDHTLSSWLIQLFFTVFVFVFPILASQHSLLPQLSFQQQTSGFSANLLQFRTSCSVSTSDTMGGSSLTFTGGLLPLGHDKRSRVLWLPLSIFRVLQLMCLLTGGTTSFGPRPPRRTTRIGISTPIQTNVRLPLRKIITNVHRPIRTNKTKNKNCPNERSETWLMDTDVQTSKIHRII